MKKYLLLLAIFVTSCTPEQKITLKRNQLFSDDDITITVFNSSDFSNSSNIELCEQIRDLLNQDHRVRGYNNYKYYCTYR